jgi:hypothetical protein
LYVNQKMGFTAGNAAPMIPLIQPLLHEAEANRKSVIEMRKKRAGPFLTLPFSFLPFGII